MIEYISDIIRFIKNEKKNYIFGYGGHSHSVVDVLLSCEQDIELIFVDKNAKNDEKLFNFAVVQIFLFR